MLLSRPRTCAVLGLCCLVFHSMTLPLTAKDAWPQFRGPNRNGLSAETDLLDEWPEEGPPLIWEASGAGRGYASVAVANGRVFTMGDGPSTAEDADEYAMAFDQTDGRQVWLTNLGSAWTNGSPDWQSSRSTPTIDGSLGFYLTAHGKLFCLDTETGKIRWEKHLKDDLGGKKGDGWGYSESVLVDGDKVVCTPGGEKATMVALNKQTGELIWQTASPGDRGAGHASILISEVSGIRVYVQTTASGVIGTRAGDGQLLWVYNIDRTTAVIPSPIVRDELVFFSAGYGRGGALLRQVADSDGNVSVNEVYPLNEELSNKHGGIVLIGSVLFGDTNDRGLLFCADLLTGEAKWEKKRGSGRGSIAIVAADGRLYLRYQNGVFVLADATAGEYREISSFKIPHSGERPSWSHPAIADGRLYVREQDRILCYDIRR